MTKRMAPLIALAVAASLLLTGCGPINAGTAAARDFTEYMSDQPGVADVQVSSSNDLPFQGSATATVVLDDGSDEATLGAVAEHIAAYLRDHPGKVSWSMAAEVDGFVIGIAEADAENETTIDLLGQARAIDGIVGGWLYSAAGGGNNLDYFLVEDPTQFIAALGQLVALDFPGPVQARDAESTFVVTSTDDVELPAPEIAAFDAVAAAYTITSAELMPGSVELRVAADDQATAATELAESLPGSAGIEFTITGGFVTREGEGDFTLVNGVIAQLIDVPGVTAISAEHDVLGVTVSTMDAVVAAQELLADADRTSALTVYYLSAEGVEPEFRIYGVPERRAAYVPIVIALLDDGYVDRIEINADRIDVVAGPYSESRMASFAATLRRLVPEGEQVRLTNSEGGVNFSFVADDVISVPSDESYGDVDAESFVEAWNSAI